MGLTAFPKGVSSFGMPVIGSGPVMTTGNVFFVDSGHVEASNANAATDPSKPAATIDGAVGKCTANNGDVIFVMPGHAENISSATSLVVDVAGVQIIGLGHARSRPTLTYTATAGTIEMDAANCRLSNIVLVSSITAVVVGINVDANDVTLDNLEMNFDATGDDFVTGIDVDAFDRCHILNCEFYGEAAAGWEDCIRLDTADQTVIKDCIFSGQWTNAPIVAEGSASANILIDNNRIYNSDTSDGNGILSTVASTGLISNNMIGTLYATAVTTIVDPGSCLCVGNMVTNAINEFGIDAGGATAST